MKNHVYKLRLNCLMGLQNNRMFLVKFMVNETTWLYSAFIVIGKMYPVMHSCNQECTDYEQP